MSIKIEDDTAIVADFETFLKFCSEARLKLTKSKEYINRKALYELNQELKMPAKDVNPRNDQQYYLPIHFYYNLALVSGLFEIDRSKKNAFYFKKNQEKISTYRALSANSQYLFLLKTYWVHCDWEAMVGSDSGRISIGSGAQLIKAIAESKVGKVYARENKEKILEHANWCLNEHIIYWEILGWLKQEKIAWIRRKSSFYYETITVTELGKAIANILHPKRPLEAWNDAYDGPHIYDNPLMSLLGMKKEEVMQQISLINQQVKEDLGVDLDLMNFMEQAVQKGQEYSLADMIDHMMDKMKDHISDEQKNPFESAFASLFPEENIPKLVVKSPRVFINGQYLFKISLKYKPKIWRTVALNAKHTLLDLHRIIQDAFEFADDHFYAFYLNEKSRKGINDPRGGDPPFVDDYQLGDLGLAVNQQFYYLFDFGDSWEFIIDLVEIKQVDKKLKKPKIVEQKGKAPEQYEFYDEDEDFDEWN